MSMANGKFEVGDWNEETYQELDGGAKLTRATVGETFTGDVEGKGTFEWLMAYRKDGTARFVGLLRIEGSVRGRSGSFVIESVGEFDGKEAIGSWDVVTGSGTEELVDLAGTGTFRAPLGPSGTYELDVSME